MAVRIGVVGAGGMAAYHIPGFRAGGAEVVALADVNLPAAQAAAEKFGIGKVYADVGEMLARADLDAVSVITPNKFHKPLVLQALKAGKHVFCEKPPALNAAEAAQLPAALVLRANAVASLQCGRANIRIHKHDFFPQRRHGAQKVHRHKALAFLRPAAGDHDPPDVAARKKQIGAQGVHRLIAFIAQRPEPFDRQPLHILVPYCFRCFFENAVFEIGMTARGSAPVYF